jgi:1-phosphatidylinositol-4-phosphate 5-kinase
VNFLDAGENQDDNIVCINEDIEVTILAEKVFAQLLHKDHIRA